MKTISFIGSHKNAGKTTVLNFVHQRLHAGNGMPICLTSIGINGEDADSFDNRPKPLIPVYADTLFITCASHLKQKAGRYQVVDIFSDPVLKKVYVLGRALTGFSMVIEGPNEKQAILAIKEQLHPIVKHGVLLIDGSMDRQFLAHPEISDAIYVSMLITSNRNQQAQVENLLSALSIPDADNRLKSLVTANLKKNIKSLLFNDDHALIYIGQDIPFMDEALKNACRETRDTKHYLYVNGALSTTLYAFLSPFRNMTVILDNFTCFQNVGKSRLSEKRFRPELRLFHAPIVNKVFLKQERGHNHVALPENMTAYNLFRDNINEIGI